MSHKLFTHDWSRGSGRHLIVHDGAVPGARWHAYVCGKPPSDLSGTMAFTFPEGKQPGRFHRFMQWAILGIYWRREP